MRHLVKYSGGGGSWMSAVRVAEEHGTADLTLLFTDTLTEAPDAYRFLIESAAQVFGIVLPEGFLPDEKDFPSYFDRAAYKKFVLALMDKMATVIPGLAWIADGRDVWDVYEAERFLGNSQKDPCSKILKRLIADRWIAARFDPADTIIYVGIDWTEKHRFDDGNGGGILNRGKAKGWTYGAPLVHPPYIWKPDIVRIMKERGLTPPKAYELGYSHSNCAGWCIKAGHEHFENVLRKQPDMYAFFESKEEGMRTLLNADVSILTDRSGDNKKKVLTLKAFREKRESDPALGFLFEEEYAGAVKLGEGGCGCALETDDDDEPAIQAAE